MTRSIYALETRDYDQFVHECDSKTDFDELVLHGKERGNWICRIAPKEAMEHVKRGVTHGTRFWVDGGTVRG